ncbi:hypothetical protein [Jiella pacifica]|nr:hypothetical protein [Jiella pacifica]
MTRGPTTAAAIDRRALAASSVGGTAAAAFGSARLRLGKARVIL